MAGHFNSQAKKLAELSKFQINRPLVTGLADAEFKTEFEQGVRGAGIGRAAYSGLFAEEGILDNPSKYIHMVKIADDATPEDREELVSSGLAGFTYSVDDPLASEGYRDIGIENALSDEGEAALRAADPDQEIVFGHTYITPGSIERNPFNTVDVGRSAIPGHFDEDWNWVEPQATIDEPAPLLKGQEDTIRHEIGHQVSTRLKKILSDIPQHLQGTALKFFPDGMIEKMDKLWNGEEMLVRFEDALIGGAAGQKFALERLGNALDQSIRGYKRNKKRMKEIDEWIESVGTDTGKWKDLKEDAEKWEEWAQRYDRKLDTSPEGGGEGEIAQWGVRSETEATRQTPGLLVGTRRQEIQKRAEDVRNYGRDSGMILADPEKWKQELLKEKKEKQNSLKYNKEQMEALYLMPDFLDAQMQALEAIKQQKDKSKELYGVDPMAKARETQYKKWGDPKAGRHQRKIKADPYQWPVGTRWNPHPTSPMAGPKYSK